MDATSCNWKKETLRGIRAGRAAIKILAGKNGTFFTKSTEPHAGPKAQRLKQRSSCVRQCCTSWYVHMVLMASCAVVLCALALNLALLYLEPSRCQQVLNDSQTCCAASVITSKDDDPTAGDSKGKAQYQCSGFNGIAPTPAPESYSEFDWLPGKSADIYDPVDDTGFPYSRLNTFKPRSQVVGQLDIVSLELKRKASVRGSHVRAYLLDDLLSTRECDALRHIHDNHVMALSHDPIVCFDSPDTLRHHLRHVGKGHLHISNRDFTKDTKCLNSSMSSFLREWGLQWSMGTGFYLGESDFSIVLDKRIEKVTGLKSVNGGAFRVVSYLQNVGYKEHTDCTLSGTKGTHDRYATIIIFLDDVHMGGHTYFPELGISVKPKKGRALVWNSMTKDGRCDPTSLHAAQPVTKGTKYILQRWYYYDNFPGVSARPPVPPIPARLPTQGLVSCDEFRHGSCRLYDTWTYDVLTRW